MSRTALEYRPDYPIAFQNQSGPTIPAFGLIQLEDASRLTAALAPKALAPDDDGEDALFVNSPTEQADGSTTGTCRSVHDGPFWVATDAVYTAGDVIGPVAGTFEAGSGGTGFKVIWPHETLQIALCAVAGTGGGDGGGGAGSGDECDCACVSGVTMPASSTVCCTSHQAFSATLLGELRSFKWQSGNRWATDPFEYETEAGCSNEYVGVMTPSTSGVSTVVLEIAVDNGCDKACLEYQRILPFRCQCGNEFELVKFTNISSEELACTLCLTPVVSSMPSVEKEVECPGCGSGCDGVIYSRVIGIDAGSWSDANGNGCTSIGGFHNLYDRVVALTCNLSETEGGVYLADMPHVTKLRHPRRTLAHYYLWWI